MHRFRIGNKTEGSFHILGDELYHLVKVLRLKEGDQAVGFDNTGVQYRGIIESIDRDCASCRIVEEKFPEVEAKTMVYIVMGLAKGEKIEWVIQKGTEIGMAGFVPLRTQRAVLQLDGKKAEQKVVRWQKIAAEAVKQCRRMIEPPIGKVADWNDLMDILPAQTQWVIAYEDEKTASLTHILRGFHSEYPIAILIGPEGGFTPEEVSEAREKLKACSVSLGPRILRTETAALTALTMVLTYFGDLG
ncbi:MAG: Ribosomal RNA small subunit methyltransferase E [Candidatus Dichloromethanomonas elyunquensis]|nr:MAG: Ribosomal RNA small subunit methyltransferase E [Candidatus Dichloromethanomonas elyunquensis]